jgi:hypothetical protein
MDALDEIGFEQQCCLIVRAAVVVNEVSESSAGRGHTGIS